MKYLIFMILFALVLSANCSNESETFSYKFDSGSLFKKHYSKDEKIEFPVITVSNGMEEREISFPLGTRIWKDKKELGCLIVKYMDKRFAAFGSDGYSFIDIRNLEVFNIASDVIYEIESHSDEFLIGIQRIPESLDYLERADDSRYDYSHQILFIIRLDYKHRRYQRLNLISGSGMPDDNYLISEEDRKAYKSRFIVKDGVLYYEHGKLKKKFPLSDFQKYLHRYNYPKSQPNNK